MPESILREKVSMLAGGISRQPADVRFPGQVEDADNVAFNVRDGASKRPGTCFIRQTNLLADDGDYLMHPIDRDGSERYLVVYGNGGEIHVFDDAGLDATINADGAAMSYLQWNDPAAAQIKMVTIADATFIVNTTVPTATLASDDFDIDRTVRDYEVMLSHNPAAGAYYETEEDIEAAPAGYFQFIDDGLTFASWRAADITRTDFNRAPGNYAAGDVNPMGFDIGFRRVAIALTAAVYDNSDKTLTQAGAFAGYEWRQGDTIYIQSGKDETTAALPAQWRVIASRTSDDEIVLQDSILKADGTTAATSGTDITSEAIGLYATPRHTFTADEIPSMEDVALVLQRALRSGGARDALVYWTNESGRGHFTIVGPFRGEDAKVYPPVSPKDSGGVNAESGVVNVVDADRYLWTGGAAEATDGTGIVDEMHPDRLDPEERWTRVSPPGQEGAQPDPTTMPVKLTRITTDPLVFALETIDWSARETGTALSNPAPDLLTEGVAIADIAYHRDRLWLFGDEYAVGSQAGDLFNFYIADAGNIVDSDPIDRSIGDDRVALIEHVIPFRKSLVLFTKAGRQYELSSPDELTPTTAAFTPSTSYRTLPLRPEPLGSLLYFAAPEGGHSSVYEYYYDDGRVQNYANAVTAHVDDLLPEDLRAIATSPNLNIAVVLPDDASDLYVYQTFWSGTDKAQSAWTKWTFDDSYRIADIAVLGETLYLLVERDGIGWCFEKIALTIHAAPCCEEAGDYAVPEAPPEGGGEDPGDGGTEPPDDEVTPLTAGRYYVAEGKASNALGLCRHNDDDTHDDLSDLFETADHDHDRLARLHRFPSYDPDSLYVCGNVRQAGVGGGPQVLRWNGDGITQVGKNLSSHLTNPDPELEHGYVTALAYFKGTLYAATAYPKSSASFIQTIKLLALSGEFWTQVATFECNGGNVVRFREFDDALWACCGDDGMFRVRPGMPARFADCAVMDTMPGLFATAGYFGDMVDTPLLVGGVPNATSQYLGGVGALELAVVEGDPLTEEYTYTPMGGGFTNNNDTAPVEGAVAWNDVLPWQACLPYNGNYYVCGMGGRDYFSSHRNAVICRWTGDTDDTLPDQAGEGNAGQDVPGGYEWIVSNTYPHRTTHYLDTYISDLCVDDGVMYGVGKFRHLATTGLTPTAHHMIRNTSASTDPDAAWEAVPNVPSWVTEITGITAFGESVVNTHDEGSAAP